MRSTMILFFVLFLFAGACLAQPSIVWQKSLGGSNGDGAYSIQQTADGGYIIAGRSYSNDGDVSGHHGPIGHLFYPDYWVVKLNSAGEIVWQSALGGSGRDEAYSIQQTTDGGFIVAGRSESNDGDVSGNHGGSDYWVVKLNSAGNMEWQKCLGGSDDDWAESIQQTTDGGFIVAGRSESNDGDVSGHHPGGYWKHYDSDSIWNEYPDSWVVKLNSGGNIEWQKSLGGSGRDEAYSIQQTTDGGFIVAGRSESNDGDVSGHHGDISSSDYWVVKLNSAGDIVWQRSLGGSYEDESSSIQQTTDGGFIVAGYSYSNDGDVSGNHGGRDYWVVKLDSVGEIVWQKSLGGSDDDKTSSIQKTSDGGYIVAGMSKSNDGDVSGHHGTPDDYPDYWVVKLSPEKK